MLRQEKKMIREVRGNDWELDAYHREGTGCGAPERISITVFIWILVGYGRMSASMHAIVKHNRGVLPGARLFVLASIRLLVHHTKLSIYGCRDFHHRYLSYPAAIGAYNTALWLGGSECRCESAQPISLPSLYKQGEVCTF